MTPATPTTTVLPTACPNAVQTGGNRLMSLDALRGFDMLWIVGGEVLLIDVVKMVAGKEASLRVAGQFQHPVWNGFTCYDLIFPLFIFLVGVAMPFSLVKRVEDGATKGQVYWKICRRTLLLVLLGTIINGMLLFDFANLRYPSVLGRIGLAYGFAAVIALNTSTRGRVAWIIVLLFGYWAAMTLIPVPGFGAGNLEPGKTLADYIDRAVLPGTLNDKVRDPEGLLSTIPAIATCLLGVLAGQWLRHSQRGGHVKAAALLAAGVVSLGLGYIWSRYFPLNKNLWTSSFVLWTAGWSLLLLGLFYLVVDVWGWRRLAFPFVVIGVNAITIYMARHFIDFSAVGQLLFGRAPINQALLPSAGLLVEWCFLYVLYRNRIFLRL